MCAMVVAALYFARDILIPVVLAVLLTFVLTPAVTFLQRWRVPRTIAIITAILVAVMIILSLGTMVANQINQLATELPRYQTTLRGKVQTLREQFGTPGVFRNAADLLDDLNKELDRPHSTTITVTPDGCEREEAASGRDPSAAARRVGTAAAGALAAGRAADHHRHRAAVRDVLPVSARGPAQPCHSPGRRTRHRAHHRQRSTMQDSDCSGCLQRRCC